ncbi:Destabilase-like protein [Leptotrombidium deliense]|uniref:lysozyme n=1 Tax=Leptotrombidium deliense TaxID=299467 RepID=A0A443SSQ6_9ACAR|nr:Destabilase-like protein [Leptotrombidium deliense]
MAFAFSLFVFIVSIANVYSTFISQQCLDCICYASTGCDLNKQCHNAGPGAYFCGPFQISWAYWSDGGKPGDAGGAHDFEKCLNVKECAEQTVIGYMRKWKTDCNNDGVIDCLDYAAIHKSGPNQCSAHILQNTEYWNRFKSTKCYSTQSSARFPLRPVSWTVYPSSNNSAHRPISINPGNAISSSVVTATVKPVSRPSNPNPSNSLFINGEEPVSDNCLSCICEASSGCDLKKQCEGDFCGAYLISWAYWSDGGKPGTDYISCALNKKCAERAIQGYMSKWLTDCNADGVIDCDDFAAIHKLGPQSCKTTSLATSKYWQQSSLPVDDVPSSPSQRGPRINVNSNGHVIPSNCMACICEASSRCDENILCSNDIGTKVCGPYQISFTYWTEAGRPGYRGSGGDYEGCANEKSCAETCVQSYVNKWAIDCNGDGVIDCLDYAAIHKAGPQQCNDRQFLQSHYWTEFQTCFGFIIESTTQYCASSECDPHVRCHTVATIEVVCGPFRITHNYWSKAGAPGSDPTNPFDFENCANNIHCAIQTVKSYLQKRTVDCNRDGRITCDDFALIHKFGANRCAQDSLLNTTFWRKYKTCTKYAFQ